MKKSFVVMTIVIAILFTGTAISPLKVHASFIGIPADTILSLLVGNQAHIAKTRGQTEKKANLKTCGEVTYFTTQIAIDLRVPSGYQAELVTRDPNKIIKIQENVEVKVNPGDVLLIEKCKEEK